MAGWDDVRRIALALPETSERTSHGNASGGEGGPAPPGERKICVGSPSAIVWVTPLAV